MPLRHR